MAGSAAAGGFAIGEQSTVFLGSARAGSAAGGSLSSMFWNSAATAQFSGLNTESSYSLILPNAELTVTSPAVPAFARDSGNIGIDSPLGASYGAYQLNDKTWVGIGINSPFGLSTKPENRNFFGNLSAYTTKLITINANPTIAFKVAPGITVGAGFQVEWARGKFAFATANPVTTPTESTTTSAARYIGYDIGFGATAGILVEPAAGTTIGVGWRQSINHTLEGTFTAPAFRASVLGQAELRLPDIVTLSIRQEINPQFRLLGTFEWTRWSRFEDLTVNLVSPVPLLGSRLSIPANWEDGFYFSGGGEYDYSPKITLRAGAAYEISPIDNPLERLTSIPDADRVWVNGGFSYKYNETTTLDFGYAHIFVDDAEFNRTTLLGTNIQGTLQADVDIFSVGYRKKW